MAYLDWLDRTLQAKLAERPVGEPVALRISLAVTEDHGLLIPTLARALSLASAWLGSRTERLYAMGSLHDGSVSVLAESAGGQTAIVSSELARGSVAVRVLLIGNHGTLSWEDSPGADGLKADFRIEESSQDKWLREALERSLESGDSEEVRRG